MDVDDDLTASNDLLRATFPDPKYDDEALIRWQYVDAPEGRVVQANADEDGERLGHYAIVPQHYRRRKERLSAALSLNTAVSERARGRGLFTTLAAETYATAAKQGVQAVFGIANANSTPGFVRRLDFSTVTPITAAYLDGPGFKSFYDSLDLIATTGWARDWTFETLRWRLSQPNAEYFAVETGDVAAIVTMTHASKVPVVAILKLFAREGASGSTSGAGAVSAACLKLKAPAAVYAGFNAKVRMRGVPVPKRLRPSPLNLITRSLDPAHPLDDLQLETFEFLDFDAY
jgi:GNAT superfamily N-acetyltransferase